MDPGQANASALPPVWVTLRTFDSPPLAELAKIHLAEAGIDCQLQNTEIVGMNPLWGNAVGFIPLQVREEDLEAAEEILSKIGSSEDDRCENCGEPLDHAGPCPVCGCVPEGEEPAEGEATVAEATPMDGLRRWQKPVIMLFLAPVLILLVLWAIGAVALAVMVLLG